jgi:hypothetical protein
MEDNALWKPRHDKSMYADASNFMEDYGMMPT